MNLIINDHFPELSQLEKQLQSFSTKVDIIELVERGFVLPKSIEIDSILFVGINPSFPKSHDKHEGFRYYPFDNTELNDEINFRNEIQYFRAMRNLVHMANVPWSHLDIFCYRETDQKRFQALLATPDGAEFLRIQAAMFRKILESSQPKVIVVCNALAREVLGYSLPNRFDLGFNYEFKFDTLIGTPRITTDGPLKGTPTFFSSMLSGQRAIDKSSFERLGWHINEVLKK
jgi:hypothetical protein